MKVEGRVDVCACPCAVGHVLRNVTEPVRFSSLDCSNMWSFARRMAKYSRKNEREYPKTEGAIPSGRSPRGIAPEVFGYSLEFLSEYCNIHRAKLHILALFLVFWSPQYQYPHPRGEYGQYQPLGVNTGKYSTFFSVLWRRKT